MRLLAAAWTSEQWTAIIVIGCTSVGTMIVNIINAIRGNRTHAITRDIQREVKPPSNGRTLAALVEGQSVIQHILATDYANRVRAQGEDPPLIPPTLTPSIADHPFGEVKRDGSANRRKKHNGDTEDVVTPFDHEPGPDLASS